SMTCVLLSHPWLTSLSLSIFDFLPLTFPKLAFASLLPPSPSDKPSISLPGSSHFFLLSSHSSASLYLSLSLSLSLSVYLCYLHSNAAPPSLPLSPSFSHTLPP